MSVKFNVFSGTLQEIPDVFYRHAQGTPASVWTVEHNLGYRPGGIFVRDSGGDQHHGRVEHLSDNVLTVSFFVGGQPVAFSGEAYIS